MSDDQEKKPDIVAWDKERGYFSKGLTYGTNQGAPAIRIDDVKGWRSKEVAGVNHQLGAKFEELRAEMERLYEEYNWNDVIYNHADYSFIPVIGHTYHLYRRKDSSLFLSLVEPQCWDNEHLGSFRLESSNKWCRQ